MKAQDLKNSILQLAIQGKLVEQREEEGTAKELLKKIEVEKKQLIKEGKIKKQKALPAIEEDEIPFDIPESWEWVRLGDVSKNIHYGYTASAQKTGNCKLLRITDIQYNTVAWEFVPYCNVKESHYVTYGLNNRDIMIARTGGTIGKTYIVKSLKEKAVFASYLIRSIPVDNINENYLKMFMESPSYWNQLKAESMGTGQPNVNGTALKKLVIPLPPLEEQKRIVAKIEELMPYVDKYDKAYTEVEKLNKKFPEDMQKSILQYAIQGKLVEQREEDGTAEDLYKQIQEEKKKLIKEGKIKKPKALPEITEDEIPFDIPENWKWVRLGEIGGIVGGGTPKTGNSEFWNDGNIPWLTPADMKFVPGKYVRNGKRFITEQGLKGSSARLMPKGTIIYSSRAPIGYIAIAENDLATNQGFKSLVPFEISINQYMYYCLISRTNEIVSRASGTTFKEISGSEFGLTIVPLPPLEEQKRIVERIEELLPYTKQLVK